VADPEIVIGGGDFFKNWDVFFFEVMYANLEICEFWCILAGIKLLMVR
jgi:hypothetical protein